MCTDEGNCESYLTRKIQLSSMKWQVWEVTAIDIQTSIKSFPRKVRLYIFQYRNCQWVEVVNAWVGTLTFRSYPHPSAKRQYLRANKLPRAIRAPFDIYRYHEISTDIRNTATTFEAVARTVSTSTTSFPESSSTLHH